VNYPAQAKTYPRRALASATAVFTILWVAIPALVGASVFTPGAPGIQLLQINLAISSFAVAVIVASGAPRFNLLMFWIFGYLFGALAPIVQVGSETYFWPGTYSDEEVFSAAVVVVLGVLSWIGGYAIVISNRMRPSHRVIVAQRLHRLGWIGLALIGMVGATAGRSFVLGGRGGLSSEAITVDLTSPVGILLRGAALVPVVLALVGLLIVRQQGSFESVRARLLIASLAVAVIVVANPVGNARYTFGAVAIAAAVALFGRSGPSRVRLLSASLVVALILIFPIADSFRYSTDQVQGIELNSGVFVGGDYDAFQQTMNGVRYVESRGARDGQQALGAVFVGVPRSIWSDKPDPTGVTIASASGYRFTNLSSPLWIEGYLDFQHIGTIFISLLFGGLSAILDRSYVRAPRSMLAVLSPILAGYQTILLRGSLMGVSAFLFMWVALAFVLSSEPSGFRRRAERKL